MPIDFHGDDNRGTYATRTADDSWSAAVRDIVDPHGKVVADIGCGGGIYSRAWSDLGAASVIGVDFSARMVEDATLASRERPSLSFRQGDASATGLPDASVDIVFERALIHHLMNVEAAFSEAARILRPGGMLIVQDRTIEDVMQPPSPQHFRGSFFEAFPRLLDVERQRRPTTKAVSDAMRAAGLYDIRAQTSQEIRRSYSSLPELQDDLRARTGRSILHELDDAELERLIKSVTENTQGAFPLTEIDFWTIWSARAPS